MVLGPGADAETRNNLDILCSVTAVVNEVFQFLGAQSKRPLTGVSYRQCGVSRVDGNGLGGGTNIHRDVDVAGFATAQRDIRRSEILEAPSRDRQIVGTDRHRR